VTRSELEVLGRAHQLFTGSAPHAQVDAETALFGGALERAAGSNVLGGHERYQQAMHSGREVLLSAARTDAAAAAVIAHALRDHAQAHELTKNVLDEARADTAVNPQTSMAQLETIRRRVARLRAQRAHVLAARWRARRHLAALRALHYRMVHHRGIRLAGLPLPPPDGRAGIAVRAALSRLGSPYVWGATGPDQFDCSGLVQWSYAKAGVHLDRTTYQQIHAGIPVPRSQVQPGDLVFPHAGHVQMAIGNNLVVEAPHAGAPVHISPLGASVQIRRPL
jgi:cell wall-associated NlpC family hydrolase